MLEQRIERKSRKSGCVEIQIELVTVNLLARNFSMPPLLELSPAPPPVRSSQLRILSTLHCTCGLSTQLLLKSQSDLGPLSPPTPPNQHTGYMYLIYHFWITKQVLNERGKKGNAQDISLYPREKGPTKVIRAQESQN